MVSKRILRLNSLNESKSSFGMNLNIEERGICVRSISLEFDCEFHGGTFGCLEHVSHEYDQIAPPTEAIVSSASTLKWNRSGSSDNATSNTTFVQHEDRNVLERPQTSAHLCFEEIAMTRETMMRPRRNFIPHPRENYVAQLPRATFLVQGTRSGSLSRISGQCSVHFILIFLHVSRSHGRAKGRNNDVSTPMISRRSTG